MKRLVDVTISTEFTTTVEVDSDNIDMSDRTAVDDALWNELCNIPKETLVNYLWQAYLENGCIVYAVDSDTGIILHT